MEMLPSSAKEALAPRAAFLKVLLAVQRSFIEGLKPELQMVM